MDQPAGLSLPQLSSNRGSSSTETRHHEVQIRPVPCVFGLDVRLIGGPNIYSGRVEVLQNGVWGTVCDDAWDLNDARVVCRMLGFQTAVRAVMSAGYGPGSGSIILDDVECLGTERNLAECSHNGYGNHDCLHHEDAGAVCANVRLVGGQTALEGRVEVYFEGSWGTVCDDLWDLNDVRVVCRMLGFQTAVRAVMGAGYGPGSGSIILDDVECLGTERNLAECSHNGYENHNCGHSEDAGAVCANVRLVGGQTASEGRVEVFFEGFWGTVCDDAWDLNDVRVVCRMLGFQTAVRAVTRAGYGPGSGSIILDDVECLGTERSLADCPHSGYENHKCGHGEDAGAVCANGALISTTTFDPTASLGLPEHVSQRTTVNSVSSAENSRTTSLTDALISTTKFDPTISLGHPGPVSQGSTVSPAENSRICLPVIIVLGAILAASYVLFLLLGLYGCHRLRKLGRMTVKDSSEQPTSKGTGSPEAASAYLNLTSPSRKSTETLEKEAPGELIYMNLEVPENTIEGDQVYTDLSFTKGSEQEGPSREYKASMKPPVARKPIVYEDMSFTKGSEQEGPSREYKAPMTAARCSQA
eukprot:XP_011665097.1 PREDICTED: deleted in malignant brain tumors 1 protein-like [Strongylocentrotus purpuratus]